MDKNIYEAYREILKGHMFHYSVDDCGLNKRINDLAKTIAEAVPEKKKPINRRCGIDIYSLPDQGFNHFHKELLFNLRRGKCRN